MTLRSSIEKSTGPFLVRLATLPKFVVPLTLAGFLLIGMSKPGIIGALFLAVVGLFVTWLVFLSWPRQNQQQRFIRVAMLTLVWFTILSRLVSN